jgi:hypothetical protein
MNVKHPKTRRRAIRLMNCELLEEKVLLAGDVQVMVSGGDLQITGDDADNGVEVIATDNSGEYTIMGVDRGGSATAINGQFGDVTVEGVDDDITINLRGGDSGIFLSNGNAEKLVVPDELRIRNSSGRLDVETDDVVVGDDLKINTDDGDDDIYLNELVVHGEIHMHTDGGNDNVRLENVGVGDDLEIRVHGGDDEVVLNDVLVEDEVDVKLGPGENTLELDEVEIGNDLSIVGGGGYDAIGLFEVVVGDRIYINTYGGSDYVCLAEVFAERLHVHLGAGDDRLDLEDVDINTSTELRGGGGFDTLGEDGANTLNGLDVRNFEEFDDTTLCDEWGNIELPQKRESVSHIE